MLQPKVKLIKPQVGCLMKVKVNLQLVDSIGDMFVLKHNDIITIYQIEDVSPPIRLNFNTKFITNWKVTFVFDKHKFTVYSKNTSQSASIYEYFDLLTQDNNNNIE